MNLLIIVIVLAGWFVLENPDEAKSAASQVAGMVSELVENAKEKRRRSVDPASSHADEGNNTESDWPLPAHRPAAHDVDWSSGNGAVRCHSRCGN